jgi:hypothetical protein
MTPTEIMIRAAGATCCVLNELENTPTANKNAKTIRRIVTKNFSMPSGIDSWDEIDWEQVTNRLG